MTTKTDRTPSTTVGLALAEALKQVPSSDSEQPNTTQPEQGSAGQAAPEAQESPASIFLDDDETNDSTTDDSGPSLLDDEDDDGDDNGVVEIFSRDCLSCKALVPFAEKTKKKCHFSRGNEHCPAQSLQIQIRLPIDDIVGKFLRAEHLGDNQRLARLYATLGTKSEYVQKRVNDALAAARSKKNA